MRLVSFLAPASAGGSPTRTGVAVGDTLVDLTDPSVGLPGDMIELLGRGAEAMARAGAARLERRPPVAG